MTVLRNGCWAGTILLAVAGEELEFYTRAPSSRHRHTRHHRTYPRQRRLAPRLSHNYAHSRTVAGTRTYRPAHLSRVSVQPVDIHPPLCLLTYSRPSEPKHHHLVLEAALKSQVHIPPVLSARQVRTDIVVNHGIRVSVRAGSLSEQMRAHTGGG